MKKYAIAIVSFLFITAIIIYSLFHEGRYYTQENVHNWKDFEDARGFFILKYPPDFILVENAATFGAGVFCLKTSNWEDVLKDEEGTLLLKNCIVYNRLRNNNPISRNLDDYAERHIASKFNDITTGETFVLSQREKLRLGTNDWIKAVYHGHPENARLYEYIGMDKDRRPVEFNAYLSSETYVPLVEEVLATLRFGQL